MKFNQGDIVLLPFPFSDLSSSKLRPAIVISNSLVNQTPEVILAQITTNIRNDEFSFFISENKLTHSLREHCEIRCHKLFTAKKNIVKSKISSFKPDACQEIIEKIYSLISKRIKN